MSLHLCVHMSLCMCPLLLHWFWPGSQKVLRALLSPVKHMCCLCKRLWHQKGGTENLTQTTLPPSKFNLSEHLLPSSLTFLSRRGHSPLIVVSPILKLQNITSKSLQGFSFKAGIAFMAVCSCCGKDEGRFTEASNKIFNEFLLQGHVSACTHMHVFLKIPIHMLICMHLRT